MNYRLENRGRQQLIILLLLIIIISNSTRLYSQHWLPLSPMPYPNHDVFGAVYEHKIYIPGGAAPYGKLAVMTNFDKMFIYDTKQDSWKISSPMSSNRRYCNVAYFGNKIWVIGGYVRDGKKETITSTVELFDPINEVWTKGISLPFPCAESVVGVLKNRLYVAYKNYFFSISVNEKQWRVEPTPPGIVEQTDGCVLKNKLFLTLLGEGLISFDAASSLWKADYPALPDGKAPRAPAVVGYQNEVWVISGSDVENEKQVRIYNPKNNEWRVISDFPQAFSWGDAVVANKEMYVFGGAAWSEIDKKFLFKQSIWKLKKKENITIIK
jgi:N-acetylneuraminic acid mutarotase